MSKGAIGAIVGIFSRTKPPQVTDPVLGELTLGRHGWEGRMIASPEAAGTISLRVERTEGAPEEADRAAVVAVLRGYQELVPELKVALFQLWQPYIEEPLWDGSWPATAQALWAMLQLEGATVRRSGAVDLLYAFKGDVWPDAVFNVQVNGGSVVPLFVDD
jgi:hypothetical protein